MGFQSKNSGQRPCGSSEISQLTEICFFDHLQLRPPQTSNRRRHTLLRSWLVGCASSRQFSCTYSSSSYGPFIIIRSHMLYSTSTPLYYIPKQQQQQQQWCLASSQEKCTRIQCVSLVSAKFLKRSTLWPHFWGLLYYSRSYFCLPDIFWRTVFNCSPIFLIEQSLILPEWHIRHGMVSVCLSAPTPAVLCLTIPTLTLSYKCWSAGLCYAVFLTGPSGVPPKQPAKRKRPSRSSGGGSSRKRAKPKAPAKDGEPPKKAAPRVRAPARKSVPPSQTATPPGPSPAMSPAASHDDYWGGQYKLNSKKRHRRMVSL